MWSVKICDLQNIPGNLGFTLQAWQAELQAVLAGHGSALPAQQTVYLHRSASSLWCSRGDDVAKIVASFLEMKSMYDVLITPSFSSDKTKMSCLKSLLPEQNEAWQHDDN